MKYLTLLATLALSCDTTYAVESGVRGLQDETTTEDVDPVLRDTIATFLGNTMDTVQNVDVPTLSNVFGENSTLSTLNCDEQTLASSSCNLLSGVEGVNVCRKVGGVELSVCVPKVLGNYVGARSDTCGCCGGECYTHRTECKCSCEDGSGVMVRHNIAKVFGRQISWNACYTPTVARQVLDSRPEFECYDGCEEAQDDTDYDTPTESMTEDDAAVLTDSNVTEAVPFK